MLSSLLRIIPFRNDFNVYGGKNVSLNDLRVNAICQACGNVCNRN